MALTDAAIRAAKPRPDGKELKLSDGKGLLMLVSPSGGKWWRYRYRFAGKEKMLSLGTYPDVGLREAREALAVQRAVLAAGSDPGINRRTEKAEVVTNVKHTFEKVHAEWLELQDYRPASLKKALWMYEKHMLPAFGKNRPVNTITRDEIVSYLLALQKHGKIETAHRFRQRVTELLKHARSRNYLKISPAVDLEGMLKPLRHKHHPAIIDPTAFGEFLRVIDGYQGQPTTRAAMQLAAYLFVRPGEIRKLPWSEISLERAEWRITEEERLKEGGFHIVPLPKQAVAILRELHRFTGHGHFVFPAVGNALRPMSDNTINSAFRRMGYERDEVAGHGFRTTASTFLTEMGYNPEAIELQLAHVPKDKTRDAYNRAAQLQLRRSMMQKYADYLDKLKRKKDSGSGSRAA